MQFELWPDSPQVTVREVEEWVERVGFDPSSWRGRYYIKYWNVAAKIKAEKADALERSMSRLALRGRHRSRHR